MRRLKVLDLNTASDEIFYNIFEGYIDYNKFNITRAGKESLEKIIELVEDADILLSDPYHMTHVPTSVVKAGKNLRLIQCYTIGYDDIDIKAARQMGVPVSNNSGITAKPMAEYTLMATLYLTKSIKYAHDQLNQGNWAQQTLSTPPEIPLELGSLTFGILGCGSIGQEVARHAVAFRCKVIYYNRHKLPDSVENEIKLEYVSFKRLLAESDILSVNVPLTDETRDYIGSEEISLMKKGAVLVNTSRGGVVDEQALADALKSGHLRGAAVDVFKDEPGLEGCPLLGLDNVILTPHSSAISPQIMIRAAEYTMENLNRIYEGKEPLRIVN